MKFWQHLDKACINFRAQNRRNCKSVWSWGDFWLWCSFTSLHAKGEKHSIPTEVEQWILIVGRFCREFSPVVVDVGSWKKRLVFVQNPFGRRNLQSNRLLFFDFNRLIPTLQGEIFLFFSYRHNEFQIWKFLLVLEFLLIINENYNTHLFLRFNFSENPFNYQSVDVMLQAIPNCYAKIQKIVSLLCSLQQIVLNLSNRNYHSLTSRKKNQN